MPVDTDLPREAGRGGSALAVKVAEVLQDVSGPAARRRCGTSTCWWTEGRCARSRARNASGSRPRRRDSKACWTFRTEFGQRSPRHYLTECPIVSLGPEA